MMKFSTLLRKPADWMQGSGPHGDIVVSSRIRLARNVFDVPFPGWSTKDARSSLLGNLQPTIEGLPEMKDACSTELTKLTSI